jgi:acetyl esterase/lipase
MKKTLFSILSIAIIAWLWRYCYTIIFSSSVTPTYADLPYATTSNRTILDIYIPTTGSGPFPVVIQIHGGAFKMGDKSAINSVQRLLDEWFAVVGMNYRLSNEAQRPAQLDDLKSVVQFIKNNAPLYNLDTTRIASRWYSAGWYLSSMMGIALANDPTTRIQASIDRFGPVDFYTMDEDIEASGIERKTGNNGDANSPESALLWVTIKENKAIADQASVLTYLSWAESIPPFLIMHGAKDPMIWAKQSERLRDTIINKFGSWTVEYHLLPNGDHGGGDFKTQATEDIVINFLKKHVLQ